MTTLENQALILVPKSVATTLKPAAVAPSNETIHESEQRASQVKSIEDMTPLERHDHYTSLATKELQNVRTDLAMHLKNVVGAIKSLSVRGQSNVLTDPLFEEQVNFLKSQFRQRTPDLTEIPNEAENQSKKKRIDSKLRELLQKNGPLSESEIFKQLTDDYPKDKIKNCLTKHSTGKQHKFKLENNKWHLTKS